MISTPSAEAQVYLQGAHLTHWAPGEWQKMICVESANAADNAVPLAPGAAHKMTATIRVE